MYCPHELKCCKMSGIEEALKQEFPEATEAECKRFVKACQDGKKDADAVKEEAEKMLEDYLDWRSCYGLDFKKPDATEDDDGADWQYAIGKALETVESVKRGEDLVKKLTEEAKHAKEAKEEKVNYDVDLSDSQKEEDKPSESKEEKESEKNGEIDEDKGEKDLTDVEKKKSLKTLSQIIFVHKSENGKPITDKQGHTILHVLPGLINRKVAHADFYGLALSFYLDRKFDRNSEEKMTLLLDVRAGEGWPNPAAIVMISFVRKMTKMLFARYPERLGSLVLFPVPRVALGTLGAIKRVFRPGIMEKINLVCGPAGTKSPLPRKSLEAYVDGDVLDQTEQVRLDYFKPIGSFSEDSQDG